MVDLVGGSCTFEVHHGGVWRVAAEVCCDDVQGGVRTSTRIEYDFDYLDEVEGALDARDARAVSCRYPVGYDLHVMSEEGVPGRVIDTLDARIARVARALAAVRS